jgi:DNA-directed RNA polymerase subunit A"
VIRHKSPKKLLEIKTSSGRKIVATDYHSFVIRKNNKIIPVSGKELKVGDRLPIMKFLPEIVLQKYS